MKQRLYVALAAGAVGALTLAACGGGASPAPLSRTPTAVTASPRPGQALSGPALAAEHGCSACHSTTGNVSVGPTWKGLFGKTETLADGSTVLVTEAYLRESILAPNAKVVQGFVPGIMPQDFREHLTDAQVETIVQYIKTLE